MIILFCYFDSTGSFSLEVQQIHFDAKLSIENMKASKENEYCYTILFHYTVQFVTATDLNLCFSCIMHTLLGGEVGLLLFYLHRWCCVCCCADFIFWWWADFLFLYEMMGKTQSVDSPREVITLCVFLRLRHSDQTIRMYKDRRCQREGLVPVDPLYLVLGAELHVSCLSTCMFYTASPRAAASPRNSCICLWLTCRE